jgi:protein phosphatase
MVADGMGAHAAGELASKIAVDSVPHLYRKLRDISAPEALEKAIVEANAEVHRRGQANIDFHNMGTTASVMVLLPQGAIVAHIGDSRVYRMRGDKLEQLTFDHSLQWELRAAGQLSGDSDLAKMVPKNVITRSLGPNAQVQVDIEGPFPVEVGDTFLLCSDGLTGQIEDSELAPILASLAPAEAVQLLVNLANLRGGPDNITVILAKVTDPALATQNGNAKPIRVGGEQTERKIHPAIWIVSSVCFLVAVLMVIGSKYIAAAVAGLGGLVTLSAGFVHQWNGRLSGVTLTDGKRLGRGPYAQVNCAGSGQLLQKLEDITHELRAAARANDWQLDWHKFDGFCKQAMDTTRENKHTAAIQAYSQAITTMMSAVRTQKKKKPSDSDVVL